MAEWCIEALAPYGQTPAIHHRLIISRLEDVSRGDVHRLLITMPPGSAKSTYASVLFPAWYLAQGRGRSIIGASHTSDLADAFSRRVQGMVRDHGVVLGYGLATEAASLWHTTNDGQYKSAGVGGPITGFRADLAIIDDPVKSRKDADSEAFRNTVWNWYRADLRTRLRPGAKVVVIQCMAGDTPVLRPDGSQTPLRDIRPGDAVATYRDGRLSAARVANWVNQGPDRVYEITTTSGRTVRANERHPFLVRISGETRWARLRDLRPGHEIFRVSGGSGGERSAPLMDAAARSRSAVIAPSTTAGSVGRMGSDPLRSTLKTSGPDTSNTDTGSPAPSMTPSWHDKAGSALSAEPCPIGPPGIGAGPFASIIATTPAGCADYSAMSATLRSGTSGQRRSPHRPPTTSDFTLDRIVEIRPAGTEDVFDIQVEETENFIADGLVSHNTRWHEDDLAGRLLKDQGRVEEGGLWTVLRIAAEAVPGDPLGREPGEMLWGDDAYGYADELRKAKREQGIRDWNALYQGDPRPDEGGVFKVRNLEVVDAAPAGCIWVRAWDLAATKEAGTNDPSRTAGVRMGVAPDGSYVIADVEAFTGGPDAVERAIIATASRDGRTVTVSLPQDPGQAGKFQVAYLTKRLVGHKVMSSPESGDKATRATGFASQVNVGNVKLVRGPWNDAYVDELRSFPSGAHNDRVDASSRAFMFLVEGGSVFDKFRAMAT